MAFKHLAGQGRAGGGTVRAGWGCAAAGTRANGYRDFFNFTWGNGVFFKSVYESSTQAHDDDDIPGSLGAPRATHLQMLGRDRET